MAEGIEVYAFATPHPNCVKFATNRTLSQRSVSLADAQAAEGDPLAKKIFSVPGVARIFIASNFIAVTRHEGVDWNDLVPQVKEIIQQHFAEESSQQTSPESAILHQNGEERA
ncbi:MAG: NifU N-terminal domain-containing protein [Abditibacteriales bacterium]|nr:NifU N-terminal domain-containing protein [Abditibacteriales bacterium]MDW8366275.1 NifU N-terminal domain-containing protein [Abditibacteriales bacterium]